MTQQAQAEARDIDYWIAHTSDNPTAELIKSLHARVQELEAQQADQLQHFIERTTDEKGPDPVAWRVHPFDYGIGSKGVYAITQLQPQRDAWISKGWSVEPLYAGQHLADLEKSRDFYKRRCELLQSVQKVMRDPERTLACDILANGQLLTDGAGNLDPARYQRRRPDSSTVVSDEAIAQAFAGTNFGTSDHRELLHVAVLKKALGYYCSHTITVIMRELGLIRADNLPTKKGRKLVSIAYQHLTVGGP